MKGGAANNALHPPAAVSRTGRTGFRGGGGGQGYGGGGGGGVVRLGEVRCLVLLSCRRGRGGGVRGGEGWEGM